MYSLFLREQARQDFARLDKGTRERIGKRLGWLIEHFNDVTPLPLTGQWAGFFKFRVGDYRIIYQANREDQEIVIYRIRHRREVYE